MSREKKKLPASLSGKLKVVDTHRQGERLLFQEFDTKLSKMQREEKGRRNALLGEQLRVQEMVSKKKKRRGGKDL